MPRTATEAFLTGCKAHVTGFEHTAANGVRYPDEFLVVGPAPGIDGCMNVQDVIDGHINPVPTSAIVPIVTWPTAEQVGWDEGLLPPHG